MHRQGGRRAGRTTHLLDLNRFILPKTYNMSFFNAMFVLNFFISSSLCRKRVPSQHFGSMLDQGCLNVVDQHMFFYTYPLKWGIKWISFEFRVFNLNDSNLKLKILLYTSTQSLFSNFLEMVILTTLFRRSPTLRKSTLKMTLLFWRCLTLFKSTSK